MRDHELAVCAYAMLANLSEQKQQALPRDRFVLLSGIEACYAGWLEIAAVCYRLHRGYEPAHQLGQYPTLPDALRSENFQPIARHWQQWCNHERAEHLAALNPGWSNLPTDVDLRRRWAQDCLEELSSDRGSSD